MEREGEEEKEGCRNQGQPDDAGNGRHFLDRSKVRILLCDNDPKSSQEVRQLLCKCSYQVTSVKSARQVIDVLNAQGPDIDIILAEVDLPVAKGLKMLKYVARDKSLRRIPIIMMSAKDEVSVVVKCLRLGAADYLVKPLRTNELLNIWTHVWRRRRMLRLSEKDVFSHDFELTLSDPSDANTNSTTLFSDDTDDKTRKARCPETRVSNHCEYESNASSLKPAQNNSLEEEPNILKEGDCTGGFFSCPKKTDLKIGESSAFLAYVKSNAPTSSTTLGNMDGNAAPSTHHEENIFVGGDTERYSNRGAQGSYSEGNGTVTGENTCDTSTFQMPLEIPVVCPSSNAQAQSRNEGQIDVSGVPSIFHLPFYYPGMMEQNMIPPSVQIFQGNLNDVQAHTAPPLLPQYNVLPQGPHMPMMPSFSYHPVGISLQSGQVPLPHIWSSMARSSTPEVTSGRTERRAAALIKFRKKRKDRCFDKKIRYVNRKRLAEKRPRVRGQFVRQVNGMDVHHNEFITGDGYSEEDEDEEPTSRELELVSSPE
ncbi:two-component response regulator-like PRR1 isoform X2 [Elaeis guineensis]|uniref:Pseudo-response regulator 1 n=1 Tax=Elaeis guineensis var. tenera TaxID=51953 RepID=A0A8N4IAA9_ELAGV|nr:two-component response regulator-like PRR1 isoform X2 [Elaeis guineensis]